MKKEPSAERASEVVVVVVGWGRGRGGAETDGDRFF